MALTIRIRVHVVLLYFWRLAAAGLFIYGNDEIIPCYPGTHPAVAVLALAGLAETSAYRAAGLVANLPVMVGELFEQRLRKMKIHLPAIFVLNVPIGLIRQCNHFPEARNIYHYGSDRRTYCTIYKGRLQA